MRRGCLPVGGARGEGFALVEVPHPYYVLNLSAKLGFLFEIQYFFYLFSCSENTFKQNLLHLLSKLKTGPGGEMVDTLVSGASAAMHAGSSPVLGT